MRHARILAVLALLPVAIAAEASPQERRDWGAQWPSIDLQNHMMYVGGLQEGSYGISFVGKLLSGECLPGTLTKLVPYERCV